MPNFKVINPDTPEEIDLIQDIPLVDEETGSDQIDSEGNILVKRYVTRTVNLNGINAVKDSLPQIKENAKNLKDLYDYSHSVNTDQQNQILENSSKITELLTDTTALEVSVTELENKIKGIQGIDIDDLKDYVNTQIPLIKNSYLPLVGGTITGNLTIEEGTITGSLTGVASNATADVNNKELTSYIADIMGANAQLSIIKGDGTTSVLSINNVLKATNADNLGGYPASDYVRSENFAGGGLEIGDIALAPLGIDETDNCRRYLNGQVILQSQFEAFTTKLKSAIALYPSLSTTETNWQSAVTLSPLGQCGKFVVDDEAGTIRLPKVVNVMGALDLSTIGQTVEAGLPNITGTLHVSKCGEVIQDHVGSFQDSHSTIQTFSGHKEGATSSDLNIDFNASLSNSIYGNSSTVQQESIKYPYFIQVATSNNEDVQIDTQVRLNNPFSLFMPYWSPIELNNLSWLRSNKQWNNGAVYVSAYEFLLSKYNSGTEQTETIADVSVTYKLADNGMKIITDKSKYDELISASGSAWFFVLDTENTQFILPYTNGFAQFGNELGKFTEAGLPNITGERSDFSMYIQASGNTGALTVTQMNYRLASDAGTDNCCRSTLSFDASKSNLIYGNSSTVQPNSVTGYLYFYIGEVEQDANIIATSELATDIANLKSSVVRSVNGVNADVSGDIKLAIEGSRFEDIGIAGQKGFGQSACSDEVKLKELGFRALQGTVNPDSDNYYGVYEHKYAGLCCYIPKFWVRIGNENAPQYNIYKNNSIEIASGDTFSSEYEAKAQGYFLPRAFIDGGEIKRGFFLQKYNSRVSSSNRADGKNYPTSYITNNNLVSIAPPDMIDRAKLLGDNWNVATCFMLAAHQLLTLSLAQMAEWYTWCKWYKPTQNYQYPTIGLSATNEGLYTHNGMPNGIAGLSYVWQFCTGITTAGTSATQGKTAVTSNDIYLLKKEKSFTELTSGFGGDTDAWGTSSSLLSMYDKYTSPLTLTTNRAVRWGNGEYDVLTNGYNKDSGNIVELDRALCGVIPKDDNAVSSNGSNQMASSLIYQDPVAQNLALYFGGQTVANGNESCFSRTLYYWRTFSYSTGGFRCGCYA